MALEDFERALAQSKSERKRSRSPEGGGRHRHRHGHHTSRHGEESRHRHKRSRHHDEQEPTAGSQAKHTPADGIAGDIGHDSLQASSKIARDSWMQAPSTLDIDYVQQRGERKSPPSQHVRAMQEDYKPTISEYELNPNLRKSSNDKDTASNRAITRDEVDYTIGDSGSHWRMTKLRAVYRQAKDSGRQVDEVALERYGSLRDFDDAREEEIEIDRRDTYGDGYVGKDKPNGDLHQERRLADGEQRPPVEEDEESADEFEQAMANTQSSAAQPIPLDQTALNKLKAQMMKAKLKRAPDAAKIEAEYNLAVAQAAKGKQMGVVVLHKMENRMLDGGRGGAVQAIDNKRGRERGLVTENEDMSIDDMVRHEKKTRNQYGGDGKAFADRIAKDGKFDDNLEYMDENATKLAKHVQKSDINLRNTAISDYRKTKHILDTCPLCHHEDTSTPPQAPLVSLATRVYLTLPTSPEITPYGLCASIVPIQHRTSLLDCDDDEWEEIRNFMKSLSRFYFSHKPSYTIIFYENAAHDGRKRHASLEAVPLPLDLGDTAPAFFREAIMAADEEWTQHKKLIDTQAKATRDGLGKLAFRRSMVSELPYFHVWFTLDGGYGHVVEDARRWPKGDLFAREVIGGMLDVGAEVVKRQGRWRKGDAEMEKRVQKFRREWAQWDWTTALMEG